MQVCNMCSSELVVFYCTEYRIQSCRVDHIQLNDYFKGWKCGSSNKGDGDELFSLNEKLLSVASWELGIVSR